MDLIEFLIKAAEYTKSLSSPNEKECRAYIDSEDGLNCLDIQLSKKFNEIFCYEQNGGAHYSDLLLVSKNVFGYNQKKNESYGFFNFGPQIPEGIQTNQELEPYIKTIKKRGHQAIITALLGSS